ncbi:MAG: NAD(P)H-dependent oxidoreductase subunit E, partial [Bacteroidota bacterium]
MIIATPPRDVEQPAEFDFTPENHKHIKEIIARYPHGKQQSAVMPLLDLAQRQHGGWIPTAAMVRIAEILDMPQIRVFDVATFYTIYNIKPVGKHMILVFTTTPCMLSDGDDILATCK